MIAVPSDKLDKVLQRWEFLQYELSQRVNQATYAQLTSLKAEATALVESFDTKPVEANEPRIEATSLSLRKAFEYEKGKGPTNSDTASQVEKINQLFHDDVKDYRENGPTGFGRHLLRDCRECVYGPKLTPGGVRERLRGRQTDA